MKEKYRIQQMNLKYSVLSHYGGGKCACVKCGFDDLRALSIDHINNDGGEHRKRVGNGGSVMYRWLLNNGYPDGLQTLCMNCQFIRKFESKPTRIPKKHQNSLTKRTRHWVSLREQGFNIHDVMVGLALDDGLRTRVRGILHRLCGEGLIGRRIPGHFSIIRQVKRVGVFG